MIISMVKVHFRGSEIETPGKMTVRELMKSLGLNPQSVLAVVDGNLVSNETRLSDQGEIKLISVISGG